MFQFYAPFSGDFRDYKMRRLGRNREMTLLWYRAGVLHGDSRSVLKLAIRKNSKENSCAGVHFSKAAIPKRTPSYVLFSEFSKICHLLAYR